MSRLRIEDLSVQRNLTDAELAGIVGAGTHVHFGPYGGGVHWGNGSIHWGRPIRRPRYPHWHDTSHWDYVPGGFRRHGNHYHYVPGRYHFHRSGHWHY